jgi:hypothetical protein
MVRRWVKDQDAKLDKHLAGEGVAKAAPTPPSDPLDAALDRLSRKLADGSWSLHPAVSIECRMDADCDRVEALVYDGIRLELKQAFELGLVALDGRVDHLKLQAIAHRFHGRDPRMTPARRLRL